MPVHYCTLHERLFSGLYKTWMDFSQETMGAINALYEGFKAVHIDPFEYRVIETPCDKCDAASRQEVVERLQKLDP